MPSAQRRQIWAVPTSTSSSTIQHCTPFTLPSSGVISINGSSDVTLTADAIFVPECTGAPDGSSLSAVDPTTIADLRDPFYASTIPQIFVIGAVTVLSYVIFIMLLITPRSFFVGNGQNSSRVLGRSAFVGSLPSTTSVVGVGGRPILQKVAALTVVISLTIATVDTFRVAGRQYRDGFEDATALTAEVAGGLEIRIVRVISDTLLWLAQVQTLIRLFPRHKEKVIIKWAGFALIVLDTIFSIINGFVSDQGHTKPRSYVDAIPALTYLFELALSLLYASMVIYYSCSRRRFAFYHPQMRNICLVALLSLLSILVPVVFFVLDIAKPDAAGWSDYVRWVGAAAASVVVWEWVERIEALEREERKDGVLGREIFDGDEMLDTMPVEEIHWIRHRRGRDDPDDDEKGNWTSFAGRPPRNQPRTGGRSDDRSWQDNPERGNGHPPSTSRIDSTATSSRPVVPFPTPPPQVASPVSRTDTTSASTVYAVHYHPVSESSPALHRRLSTRTNSAMEFPPSSSSQQDNNIPTEQEQARIPGMSETPVRSQNSGLRWQIMSNPFKRRRASPPPEIMLANPATPRPSSSISQVHPTARPGIADGRDLKSRIIAAAIPQSGRFRTKVMPTSSGAGETSRRPRATDTSGLPVTVIPAPQRRSIRPAMASGAGGTEGREDRPAVIFDERDRNANSASVQLTNAPRDGNRTEGMSSATPSGPVRRILWEDRIPPSNGSGTSPVAAGPSASGADRPGNENN